MSLAVRKAVLGIFYQVGHKSGSVTATEVDEMLEISDLKTRKI